VNLEEFVTLTLVQIKQGIVGANTGLASAGQPATYQLPLPTSKDAAIEFDVAVTVSVSGKAEAGGKAGIKIVEGAVGGKLEGAHEQVSRVRFSVIALRG
jgi:hypothetical protein